MARAVKYTVGCDRCYSWHRSGLTRKVANIEAVGHMRANPGHSCSVLAENPPLAVFANPGQGADSILSFGVIELAYWHAEDGKAYKHKFKAGVCAELLDDGSVRLYHKNNKPLWGDF